MKQNILLYPLKNPFQKIPGFSPFQTILNRTPTLILPFRFLSGLPEKFLPLNGTHFANWNL